MHPCPLPLESGKAARVGFWDSLDQESLPRFCGGCGCEGDRSVGEAPLGGISQPMAGGNRHGRGAPSFKVDDSFLCVLT